MTYRFETVRFESPSTVSDGQGGEEQGWTNEFECRAEYVRLRGSETVIASRLEGRQPTVIRVRSFASTTKRANTDWRIVDTRSGEVFNIRSIIETEDRIHLDFAAESGVSV